MKFIFSVFLAFAVCQLTLGVGPNLVCFYDASSADRDGLAKFSTPDLEIALQFCTHLIYGYAGINSENFQLKSLNTHRDLQRRHFATITELKEKYPHIKVLLSVGGDKDFESPNKYVELLEGGTEKHRVFAESARDLVRSYNFDGLDLAFQLPRNKPRKVHSSTGQAWKSIKKLFTGDFVVDEKADQHKEEFTNFVGTLRSVFNSNNLMISLTVLPNVNSTWYFNAPVLANHLDFVNLAAFDFTTPDRNAEEADYTAPLYQPPLEGNRLPHYNVDFQVDYWIGQRFPHSKINVGIASYGRAWKTTQDSNVNGLPIVSDTKGAAEPGPQTRQSGLLNWAEICLKLPNPSNVGRSGADSPLRRIADPSKKYGNYAFRPADENGEHGMWVSYDDPDTASNKATYVKTRGLGGAALFDLSLDDFNGQCTGDKFPILRAIKYRLL